MSLNPMPDTGPHTHPYGTTDAAGVVELATDAEVVSNPTAQEALAVTAYTLGRYTGLVGSATSLDSADLLLVRDTSADQDVSTTFGDLKDAVTPPQATTEVQGIVELATDAEVIAGTDTERAVTPSGLDAWAEAYPALNPATETSLGVVELATTAEAVANPSTNEALAVTPYTLGRYIANLSSESSVDDADLFVFRDASQGKDVSISFSDLLSLLSNQLGTMMNVQLTGTRVSGYDGAGAGTIFTGAQNTNGCRINLAEAWTTADSRVQILAGSDVICASLAGSATIANVIVPAGVGVSVTNQNDGYYFMYYEML